jgi:hypothetical protein
VFSVLNCSATELIRELRRSFDFDFERSLIQVVKDTTHQTMPPKINPKNVTTRTASSATHTSSASQTQAAAQMDSLPETDTPLPESSDSDDLDDADVAQLKEQIQTLTQAHKDDQETLRRVLEQLATLAAAQVAQQNPVRSVERDDTSTMGSQDRTPKYSKKQPDPTPLSDGVDPTFESWKLQIQGKFRVNADHFEDEEAKMLYLFNRTTGDAQEHLHPRYEDDSPMRFATAQEMIQHLATIYVNPNRVRDAKYDYNRLTMKTSQTFVEFQTQFLHLAGKAQIPAESLRLDLFDRLTTQLQEKLAAQLRTLDTFAELSASCLSLDTELRRIAARQRRFRDKPSSLAVSSSLGVGSSPSNTAPRIRAASEAPRSQGLRQSTPMAPVLPEAAVICFNCHKPGHIALVCPEPKKSDLRADLKEIEEDENASEESGKEEP